MPRDYYVVLGISTSATAEDIHAAFRRRSKELHPDVSRQDSGPFLELQEAYAVLSDPVRRRHYDRDSTSRVDVRITGRPSRQSTVPLRRRRADVVLRPQTGAEPITARSVSIMDDFQSFRPSFDELFDRLWANFGAFARPKGERSEGLNVEIVLSPADAQRGGRVRISVPARIECPTCGGRGGIGGHACWRCRGDGALLVERPIDVDYPGGLRDGGFVAVPLSRFGIENFYLTVIFRVSADAEGTD